MPTRHLILCIDGTWNDPTQKTNVWQLFSRLDGEAQAVPASAEGIRQHYQLRGANLDALYIEGVGAGGQRVLGGALGVGLHDRVLDLYVLASRLWQPGTQLWVFGFSRGAWAARSLAGFIAATGLLTAQQAAAEAEALRTANARWRAFKEKRVPAEQHAFWDAAGQPQPIQLVGVWDTVGALGVPFFNGLRSIDRFERQAFDFADLELSPRVAHGRHALSIDETRFDFIPTLWKDREGIEQRWFPGVHADVGGGYPQRGLADLSLAWMLGEVDVLSGGALLKPGAAADLKPDAHADRHEEATSLVWQLRPRRPRDVPERDNILHGGVRTRLQARTDWRPSPLRRLKELAEWYAAPGTSPETLCPAGAFSDQSIELDPAGSTELAVDSRKWWNATGLRVRAGQRYRIKAAGQWQDKDNSCDANGYPSAGHFPLQVFEWLHARRVADADWFRLIAAVHADAHLEARNAGDGNFGEDALHLVSAHIQACDRDSQLAAVGADGTVDVQRDGYLYLFANDSSAFYGNNRGTLQATVERLA